MPGTRHMPFAPQYQTFPAPFEPGLTVSYGSAPSWQWPRAATRSVTGHLGIGLFAALASVRHAFQSWRCQVRSRQLADQLTGLNDHLLRDMGLSHVALRYEDPAALLRR
jgi:uncharacterized protein YjiS (DUF1127 family)